MKKNGEVVTKFEPGDVLTFNPPLNGRHRFTVGNTGAQVLNNAIHGIGEIDPATLQVSLYDAYDNPTSVNVGEIFKQYRVR